MFTTDEIKSVFTPERLLKKRVIIRRLLNKYKYKKPLQERLSQPIPKETQLKKERVIIRRLNIRKRIRNANKRIHNVKAGRKFHAQFNDAKYCGILPKFEIFAKSRLENFHVDTIGVRFLSDMEDDLFFDSYSENKIVLYFENFLDKVIIFALENAGINKDLNYIIFIGVELSTYKKFFLVGGD